VDAFNAAFLELGYPYTCIVKLSEQEVKGVAHQSGFGGYHKTGASVDELENELKSVCDQFSVWTGRVAPESIIAQALSLRTDPI